MFVGPGDDGLRRHDRRRKRRTDDMTVNPTKEKKLTNMRATGSDRNILLKPPRQLSLEAALEYIEEDELVEVTPSKIRLRKILLTEHDAARKPAAGHSRQNRRIGNRFAHEETEVTEEAAVHAPFPPLPPVHRFVCILTAALCSSAVKKRARSLAHHIGQSRRQLS